MSADTILEFREISKVFPGVQALDHVSFDVKHGEVHAIVGENGAGKSTLMKILIGLYQPDGGQLLLNGEPTLFKNSQQALHMGIAMVPQELNLVPEMTVAENIFLGIQPHSRIGLVDRKQLQRKARETLDSLNAEIETTEKLKRLTVAEQQMIQIARALAFQCNILIMDEPTAALSDKEKTALFDRLHLLKQKGTTVLYISHRMEEIFEIADRITVLRDGKVTGTRLRSETTQDEIVRLMIGRSVNEFLSTREKHRREGEPILEIRNLSRKGSYQDISLSLHPGEIVGVAGLVGALRTETFLGVIGDPPPYRGEIFIEGRLVSIKSPVDAIRLGIGYVPEERKRHGIFPIMSVAHNTSITFLQRLQHLTVVDQRAELKECAQLSEQFDIHTSSLSQKILNLSGGNQQKVILARWIGSRSKILFLDEPTRGIDINAKIEIHKLIVELADQGKSIILISSELQEILAIADRIVVMREGRIVGEVNPKDVTQEDVLRLAMLGSNHRETELSTAQ